METAPVPALRLKPGQSIEKKVSDAADSDPDKMIRFLETFPVNELEDPGSFLSFIYRKSLAHRN